jgi:hypothetical protein
MAHVAGHAVLFARVDGMVERHWLWLSPVQGGGECKPSNGKRCQNPAQKQYWTLQAQSESLHSAYGEKNSLKTRSMSSRFKC